LFFKHWYIDASKTWLKTAMTLFSELEQALALVVTLKHLFEPLYQDYTLMGQAIGPFFRMGRVILTLGIYIILAAIFLASYIVWIFLPVFLIFQPLIW